MGTKLAQILHRSGASIGKQKFINLKSNSLCQRAVNCEKATKLCGEAKRQGML